MSRARTRAVAAAVAVSGTCFVEVREPRSSLVAPKRLWIGRRAFDTLRVRHRDMSRCICAESVAFCPQLGSALRAYYGVFRACASRL